MHLYQFISEAEVQFNGLPAIEYIYRGFSGEPHVQRRKLSGGKGQLGLPAAFYDPVNVTESLETPVDEGCYQLADGFSFRE